MPETPLFLRSGEHQIFAILHEPAPAETAQGSTKTAYVFCPPFAEEEKSAHRVFVDLARRIAAAGHAVLRIQYRGCGDSEGEFEAFSCPEWRNDIGASLEFLRERTGAPLGLLGLRLGASLAAEAAEVSPVERLILWEPIIDGRQYMSLNLRRKLLRRMLTEKEGCSASAPHGSTATPAAVRESPPDTIEDGIDFEGYLLVPRLQEDIASINLLHSIKHFHGNVLLTQIASQTAPGKPMQTLAERYQKAGADVEAQVVVEQPIWNLMDLFCPDSLIHQTAQWINKL